APRRNQRVTSTLPRERPSFEPSSSYAAFRLPAVRAAKKCPPVARAIARSVAGSGARLPPKPNPKFGGGPGPVCWGTPGGAGRGVAAGGRAGGGGAAPAGGGGRRGFRRRWERKTMDRSPAGTSSGCAAAEASGPRSERELRPSSTARASASPIAVPPKLETDP